MAQVELVEPSPAAGSLSTTNVLYPFFRKFKGNRSSGYFLAALINFKKKCLKQCLLGYYKRFQNTRFVTMVRRILRIKLIEAISKKFFGPISVLVLG